VLKDNYGTLKQVHALAKQPLRRKRNHGFVL
jgi:hypothetical protein